MRFLAAALPFAGSFVCAEISLGEAIGAVTGRHKTDGGARLRVHPEGPLNILRGHPAVNNDAIAKKRLFSPPIRTAYVLEEVNSRSSDASNDRHREYKYSREPENDEICNFNCSEKMDYLRAFYDTLKILFRLSCGVVDISSSHAAAFYSCVRWQLRSDSERARFFAALFLLANGERIEVKHEKETGEDPSQPKVSSVLLTHDRGTLLKLSSTMSCFEEVRTVFKFFAKHNVAGVGRFALHYTDSPEFLIQAYLCAFADGRTFIGEVFACIDSLLADIYSGHELDAARSRYFTADDRLLEGYAGQYDALKRISENNDLATARRPRSFKLDNEKRLFLTTCTEDTGDGSAPLLFGLIRDNAVRLLGKADGFSLPNAYTVEVENARDPMALYDALTRWLAYAPLCSEKELLAGIDQLLPTFIKLLKQGKEPGVATYESAGSSSLRADAESYPTAMQDESPWLSDSPLSANNPLVLLIANILGSLLLDDYEVRYRFFRVVLTDCVSERAELFPNIRIHPSLYCPESDEKSRFRAECELWGLTGKCIPNKALRYLRQLAAAEPVCGENGEVGAAPIVGLLGDLNNVRSALHRALAMFLQCKNAEGVRFLRSYAVPDASSATFEGRLDRARWFRMAIMFQLYGEARWVCDGWNDLQFAQPGDESAIRHSFTERDLPPLSNCTVAKIFPDGVAPASLRALLELSVMFAASGPEYDGICSVVSSNADKLDPVFIAELCQTALIEFSSYRCMSSSHLRRPSSEVKKELLEHLKSLTREMEALCVRKFGPGASCEEIFRDCEQKLADFAKLY